MFMRQKTTRSRCWDWVRKMATIRAAESFIRRIAAVLRTHRGGSPPHWGCGPDAGTGGTWGTHHSQVYHQEERHQAEHHPALCSHQWCRWREEWLLLPTTTSHARQKKSKWFQCQDRNRQHSNYRGIMLRSTPGKVLKRVLLERMKETANPKLRDQQAGFRRTKLVQTRSPACASSWNSHWSGTPPSTSTS